MSEAKENGESVIALDDTLDITMAATYFERLSKLLNEQKAIVINGENIERIDGAGLQLLVAFFKSAEALHISVQWQGCSEALKKSAKLSGLTGSLAID